MPTLSPLIGYLSVLGIGLAVVDVIWLAPLARRFFHFDSAVSMANLCANQRQLLVSLNHGRRLSAFEVNLAVAGLFELYAISEAKSGRRRFYESTDRAARLAADLKSDRAMYLLDRAIVCAQRVVGYERMPWPSEPGHWGFSDPMAAGSFQHEHWARVFFQTFALIGVEQGWQEVSAMYPPDFVAAVNSNLSAAGRPTVLV